MTLAKNLVRKEEILNEDLYKYTSLINEVNERISQIFKKTMM